MFVPAIQICTITAQIRDLKKEEHNEKRLYGGERGVIGSNCCLVDNGGEKKKIQNVCTHITSKFSGQVFVANSKPYQT